MSEGLRLKPVCLVYICIVVTMILMVFKELTNLCAYVLKLNIFRIVLLTDRRTQHDCTTSVLIMILRLRLLLVL